MTFRIGQKVVCVDDRFGPFGSPFVDAEGTVGYSNGITGGLTKGAVYTIANIITGVGPSCLVLHEISRVENDPGFLASRFRPIVERKTDISIFTAMLNPSKRSVDA